MTSKTLTVRVGDDVRDVAINLQLNKEPLALPVSAAILKILHDGETKTRTLEVDNAPTLNYRLTDEDLEELGEGATRDEPVTLPAEVYATFSDGSNATFPTAGQLTIVIRGIL